MPGVPDEILPYHTEVPVEVLVLVWCKHGDVFEPYGLEHLRMKNIVLAEPARPGPRWHEECRFLGLKTWFHGLFDHVPGRNEAGVALLARNKTHSYINGFPVSLGQHLRRHTSALEGGREGKRCVCHTGNVYRSLLCPGLARLYPYLYGIPRLVNAVLDAVEEGLAPCYGARVGAVLVYLYMQVGLVAKLLPEKLQYERVGPAREVAYVKRVEVGVPCNVPRGLQNPLARPPVHVGPFGTELRNLVKRKHVHRNGQNAQCGELLGYPEVHPLFHGVISPAHDYKGFLVYIGKDFPSLFPYCIFELRLRLLGRPHRPEHRAGAYAVPVKGLHELLFQEAAPAAQVHKRRNGL